MKKNKTIYPHNEIISYNDLSIRFVFSIIAAHIMSSYNEPDGFFEVILTASYLRGFIASFVISFLIINLIYLITIKLNKTYRWHQQTLARFIWQVVLAFSAPAILVFLLVALFFSLYGINILHTEYIVQDYPLVLLMLLCINLYYFGLHYFLLTAKHIEKPPHEAINPPNIEPITTDVKPDLEKEIPTEEPVYKETLIITTALKTFPVSTDNIAYIYRVSDGVFIRLKSMKDLSESYPVNYSLKDLEALLDPSLFFRVNRQMIVSRSSVDSFRNESRKTLFLSLIPKLFSDDKNIPGEYIKLSVVSETKTPRFKIWMNR